MVLKKKLKFFSKRFGSFKNLPYLCNRFPLQKREDGSRKNVENFFSKRFGSLGKLPYLCNRFPLLKSERETEIKRTSVLRYNSFFEVFEQLNKFFPHSQECNFKTITFEIRAKI